MSRTILTLLALTITLSTLGQCYDDFSDTLTSHRTWQGDWHHFAINRSQQLQSQVPSAAESILYCRSTATINAEWSGWARISGTCSAYNYIRIYLTSLPDSLHADSYFIQIGGTNKNIVLYQQRDSVQRKVIENPERKKILNTAATCLDWKATRTADGVFHLYSRIDGIDSTFVEEGTFFANHVQSFSFALVVCNTKQRGYDFYMDNISVTGEPQVAPINPQAEDTEDSNTTPADIRLLNTSLSPNNDGWEDEACIAYTLPNDNYKATLNVYTATGIHVKEICTDLEVPEQGTLCWNGTTAQSNTADIGVYVLVVELKNSKTKDVLRQRFALSLTL